ncbi:MAG: HAMP domain-containing histidine kinase [Elusimicrobia bacterium]|nr:HAMP domain-containing histidine kinase [Elusimicrobiota bacterium]
MNEKTYTLTKKELNFEKNKVIARFASIASHDLKNVVAGLSNIAYFLNKSIKIENPTQEKMLGLLSKEVGTLNTRISEILDMTRVKQVKKEPCDLKDVLETALQQSDAEGVTLEANIQSVKIYGDKEKLAQVFFNIIKNSKDAIDNKGTVKIDTVVGADTVSVTIIDHGKGMDAETLDQCFDPMFSTKTAKSIGMGLTVALQIVEMHNGKLEITSSPSQGTTAVVTLSILKD